MRGALLENKKTLKRGGGVIGKALREARRRARKEEWPWDLLPREMEIFPRGILFFQSRNCTLLPERAVVANDEKR